MSACDLWTGSMSVPARANIPLLLQKFTKLRLWRASERRPLLVSTKRKNEFGMINRPPSVEEQT